MAFIQCDFFSETLGGSCSMNVILPQATTEQIGVTSTTNNGKHPVLWLLHGATDDHTAWMRYSSIERYAAELGLAVIMPAANLSFYQDMATGPRYGTFLSDELPQVARSFFPLSEKREKTFIAGLSMGGYGTMLQALRHPERYAAAASLSGVLDIASWGISGSNQQQHWLKHIFADNAAHLRHTDADLLHLLSKHKKDPSALPRLFACCGTEDPLISHNHTFHQRCQDLNIPLTYEEGEGAHLWDYWDRMIQRALNWMMTTEAPTG